MIWEPYMTRREIKPGRIYESRHDQSRRIVTMVDEGIVFYTMLPRFRRRERYKGRHQTVKAFISWVGREVTCSKVSS